MASDALNDAKYHAGLAGNDSCEFDLDTGDILFGGVVIGNLGADVSFAPIDMSLRLWSDEVVLAPVLFRLGSSDIVHVRGELVPHSKGAAPRMAPRHFASIAREKAWQASDIDAWMGPLLAKTRGDRSLMSFIEMGQVERTFWISVLGARLLPMPKIDRSLLKEVAAVELTIFLENYTELTDGNPSRLWFPRNPESAARMQSARF